MSSENNCSREEEEADPIMAAMFKWNLELAKNLLVELPEKATDVLAYFLGQCLDETVGEHCDQDVTKVDVIKFADKEKEFLKLLLDLKADVNEIIHYDWGEFKVETSHFSFACSFADLDIVRLMMDHGADLDFKDQRGCYPIQYAFQSGKLDKINIFIERGIGSDDDINRLSLLNCYVSSKFATTDMVTKLLQLGANIVNHIDQSKSTLNHAVQGGNLQIVELLIANGADIKKFNCQNDNELNVAVQTENIDIVRVLLNLVAVDHLMKELALEEAVKVANPEIVGLLLDNGAKFDSWTDNGPGETSPINYAAANGHKKLLEFFINRGFEYDESLLLSAVEGGQLKILDLLLTNWFDQFDVNSVFPHYSETALCVAIQHSTLEMVEFLLDRGAKIDNGRSLYGYPLHYAATADRESSMRHILQLLLDRGADVNVEHEGRTPLSKIGNSVMLDHEYFMRALLLIEHVVIMESQNLHVSDVNLQFIEENDGLKKYRAECESEIELLKGKMFDDSLLSYYDILIRKDECKLAAMATEVNYAKFKQTDFFDDIPIYGGTVVERFYTGVLRRRDFEFIRVFFNYLCTRKTDKLPRLPFTFVCDLFNYLSYKDVCNLRQLKNQPSTL